MKPFHTNTRLGYTLLLGIILCFPEPLFAASQSSSVTEIITSAHVDTGGVSSVEMSQTTVINGERSSYHFATTTGGTVTTQTSIVRSTSGTTSSSTFSLDQTSTKLPSAFATSTTPAELWSQLEALLNYLHAYVEQLF
ncbi:MAG: hypothetical protein H6780_03230 [Candidatus Nomurabacteria bacterium]|nr:MAG: hypothetical protein H6780_03230 [Candidatus Nomurabacteria bacterium]